METAELHRLAHDRRQSTPEIHGPNDFYGHAATLKRYAGLPAREPLAAVIEHGLTAVPQPWWFDLRAPFPTFLCAGPKRAEVFTRARPGSVAVPIGPLIRYAGDGEPRPRPKGRLLAFPAHSTHDMRASFDAAGFARTLAGYRDRFDHVTVCLYWRDVLDGAEAPYRAEGFDCVTAGHMFDPAFLPRLRAIIEDADVVVTNRFGSYVAYAVALGRPVWFRRQRITPLGDPGVLARESVDPDVDEATTRHIAAVFEEEADELTEAHLACLEPIAGFEHVRSPEALRAILAEAADRYRDVTSRPRRAWHRLLARVARPVAQRLPRAVVRRVGAAVGS